jgi:uncharacterized protein with PIN domain
MSTGKCPKCERVLTSVSVEPINIGESPQVKLKGGSFVCPYCHVILWVGLDPLAMKADIVGEILRRLGQSD